MRLRGKYDRDKYDPCLWPNSAQLLSHLSTAGSGISVNQGGSATQTFNVTGVNGFSGRVSFTAQNLPTGVSAQFAEGSSSNTYTLTLSATNAASLTGSNPPIGPDDCRVCSWCSFRELFTERVCEPTADRRLGQLR